MPAPVAPRTPPAARPIPTPGAPGTPDAPDARTLRTLAVAMRALGREAATVHRRWFAPRDRREPVDELLFEHEWRAFVQRGVDVVGELERALPAARRHLEPQRPPALERLEAQLEHARAWSVALRMVTRPSSARVLLETVLPHEPLPTVPHPALCCCAATLDELAAPPSDPAPPQAPARPRESRGDPMTRSQEEFDAAVAATPALARLSPDPAAHRRALRRRWSATPAGRHARWNSEERPPVPAIPAAPADSTRRSKRPDAPPPPRGTDPRAVKFNQGAIAVVTTLALLSGDPWLLLPLGAVLAAGTLEPRLALFKRFYTVALRPALRLPPPRDLDDGRPHAFAQGMVAATTLLAWLAFALGPPLVGAVLAGANVALCTLAIAGDWCLGCQIYLHARRLQWRLRRHG